MTLRSPTYMFCTLKILNWGTTWQVVVRWLVLKLNLPHGWPKTEARSNSPTDEGGRWRLWSPVTPTISSQSCVIGQGREVQHSLPQEKPLCLREEVSWDNWAGSGTVRGIVFGMSKEGDLSILEAGLLQSHYIRDCVPRVGGRMQKSVGKASRQAVFILNLHSCPF